MSDRFALMPSRRVLTRVLAFLFLLVSVQWTVGLVFPLFAPEYMATTFTPFGDGPLLTPDPLELLPADARAEVEATKGARQLLEQRMSEFDVRWRLFLVELFARVPAIGVFFCIGVALWKSSRAPPAQALSSVPWLFRASLAGIAMAILAPIAEGLRTGLLLDGVVPTALLHLNIDVDTVQQNLLFATAALAASWSIEAGLRARAELQQIV